MPTYESEFQKLRNKYEDFNFDIKAHFEIYYKFGALDDFTLSSSAQRRITNAYRKTLTQALTQYLESRARMGQEKDYTMADIDVVNFTRDFDNVIHGLRSDEATANNHTYLHTPLEGGELTETLAHVWKDVKHFNKPMHEIWAHQIRNGKLNPDDLITLTRSFDNTFDALDEQTYNAEEHRQDLATYVMAQRAMQTAVNNRSWTSWLNPLNWGRNFRENSYLEELTKKIDDFRQAGLPVDNVVPATCNERMLGHAHANILAYAQSNPTPAQMARRQAAKQNTTRAEIIKEEPTAITKDAELAPVANELTEVMVDNNTVTDVTNQLNEMLPKSKQGEMDSFFAIKGMLKSDVAFTMKKANERFDEAIADNKPIKQAMGKVVRSVYTLAASIVSENTNDLTVEQKATETEKVARILIEKFTAASVYPEKLSSHVNDYLEKSTAQYKELMTKYNDDLESYKTEMVKYEEGLDEGTVHEYEPRINVFSKDDANFAEPISSNQNNIIFEDPNVTSPSIDRR